MSWGVPRSQRQVALERGLLAGTGMEKPSETSGIKAFLGPDSAQKPGPGLGARRSRHDQATVTQPVGGREPSS